jgi:hypothetical protein
MLGFIVARQMIRWKKKKKEKKKQQGRRKE